LVGIGKRVGEVIYVLHHVPVSPDPLAIVRDLTYQPVEVLSPLGCFGKIILLVELLEQVAYGMAKVLSVYENANSAWHPILPLHY
jgi:hypothetical protein